MWKIWYDNGVVYSGNPEDAPGVGVLVIVQEDDRHGWECLEGKEYFYWEDKGKGAKWWAADREGFFDYMFNRPGKKVALLGRFVEDDDFDRIHQEAMTDPDFPKKTGYDAKERKPAGA